MLHHIRGFADACRIQQPQGNAVYGNILLYYIPGGAGNIGNNRFILLGQGIQKTGLAHIRPSDNCCHNPLPQNLALPGRAEHAFNL
ncbi:hypothetical protein D3C76_1606260 [compost metagenome]